MSDTAEAVRPGERWRKDRTAPAPSLSRGPGSCAHSWKLAEPNGTPTVSGRCRRCGEVREFKVGFEGDSLEDAVRRGDGLARGWKS